MKKASSKKPPIRTHSPGTAELLFEIGVEELPYQFIAPALSSLEEDIATSFAFHGLPFNDSIRVFGTPRRLVLVVERLANRTNSKDVSGPSRSVGFDQAGNPTKAAVAFAKSQGVPVESLKVRQTPKGEYVFAVREGQSTELILPEILPEVVGELSFPKAMKWNEIGVRFARPIRWVIALFAGEVVPVEIAGVKASNRTYGHRVLWGDKSISVSDYETYNKKLGQAGVVVDQQRRRTIIENQLSRLCAGADLVLNMDESLLDQAVFTTEWPYTVLGNFKPEYLSIPSEILIMSMKEHQGFFSVRNKKTGELAPHFMAVTNNHVKDMSLIRSGNERVLAARLADAKFFFDEDRKTKLEKRVPKLSGMIFHQKLGTMAERQDRILKLVTLVASKFNDVGPSSFDFTVPCRRAAELCKADLLTSVVGEFPELQGIMGGEYAKYDGEPEDVWKAIRDQYLPRGMEGGLPETLEGLALSLADRLDTIAAFFHAGIIPRGSEDPYALRRHALSIVRIIVEGNLRVDLSEFVREAENIVAGGSISPEPSMLNSPLSFIFERFRFYAGTTHIKRDDVMSAVCETAYSRERPLDLLDILKRMESLQAVTAKAEFDPLIVGFKRASRIVEKEQWDQQPVDPDVFADPSERELYRQVQEVGKDLRMYIRNRQYDRALNCLVDLKPAIDSFFAGVMVNAEDQKVRSNRLSLLKEVEQLFKSFADFSRIMVQGG